MGEPDRISAIAARLDGVQPQLRDEPNAYKRAVARMAIAEYMREEDEMIRDAFQRHG
ncbi:MAG: hypothetical protein MJH10_10140 [Epibacterium sp.]|nr:hypothetical protein [Epibacterium sp.]NQX73897.1 hypothetical protein [Epibacterium sp.]